MKHCARIILCFALAVVFGASTSAQESKSYEIFERYIDLNNLTIVFTKPIAITDLAPNLASSNPWYELGMTMYYTYKGKNPSNSKIYGITFGSSSKKFQFIREARRSLLAVVDGERLQLGEMRLRETGKGRNYIRETLDLEISRKSFDKLTKASVVRMQLGSYEFDLKDQHLQVLRQLDANLTSQMNKKGKK